MFVFSLLFRETKINIEISGFGRASISREFRWRNCKHLRNDIDRHFERALKNLIKFRCSFPLVTSELLYQFYFFLFCINCVVVVVELHLSYLCDDKQSFWWQVTQAPTRPGWCLWIMFFFLDDFSILPFVIDPILRCMPRDLVLISCGVVSFSTTPSSSLGKDRYLAPNPPTHSSFSPLPPIFFVSSVTALQAKDGNREEVERSRSFCARANLCATFFSFFFNGLRVTLLVHFPLMVDWITYISFYFPSHAPGGSLFYPRF